MWVPQEVSQAFEGQEVALVQSVWPQPTSTLGRRKGGVSPSHGPCSCSHRHCCPPTRVLLSRGAERPGLGGQVNHNGLWVELVL